MKTRDDNLKAMEMIGDWSKWCATIQVAAIAGIAALGEPTVLQGLNFGQKVVLVGALGLFAFSTLAASMILKCLPACAQKAEEWGLQDVYHMGSWQGTGGRIRLYHLVGAQTAGFVGGLVVLAALVATTMFSLGPWYTLGVGILAGVVTLLVAVFVFRLANVSGAGKGTGSSTTTPT